MLDEPGAEGLWCLGSLTRSPGSSSAFRRAPADGVRTDEGFFSSYSPSNQISHYCQLTVFFHIYLCGCARSHLQQAASLVVGCGLLAAARGV